MPKDSENNSLSNILRCAWTRPRVSFRYYGPNNESRRPIFHRFDIKGGATMLDAMRENIVRHNALYRRLLLRGS